MIWMNELFEGKRSLFATKTLKLLQGTPGLGLPHHVTHMHACTHTHKHTQTHTLTLTLKLLQGTPKGDKFYTILGIL